MVTRTGITGIHQSMMQLHQDLILNRKNQIKTCVLMYPTDVINSNYKNKQFIVQCNTSTKEIERMKNLDSTFSSDSIAITLIFEDLENTVAVGSSGTPAKLEGFKLDNVIVKYAGKKYIVKEESTGEYDTSITLYCDAKN